MKKFNGVRIISVFFSAAILVVAFNNCSEGFLIEKTDGGSSLFSMNAGETCEDALKKVYEKTYHPFLTQTCGSCHTNGPGLGVFGSSDLSTSFTSFTSIGVTKINKQSLNENHKPPATGAHNSARIAELESFWTPSETDYLKCVSSNNGGAAGGVVKTTGKLVPANLNEKTFVRMEWDLESESSSALPLVAGIEIRRGDVGGITRGYEMRNPTLRLKTAAAGNYEARALNILLNGQLKSEVTTYSNMVKVVGTTTDLNLSPGTANSFMEAEVNLSSDMIALDFSSLRSTSATGSTGGGGSTGGSGGGGTTTVTPTYNQLAAAGGVFAVSCFGCHGAVNPRGGLNMTVYENAKTAALNIKSRMNNPANPMPTGGILGQAQRDLVNAWVDNGTPQ